MAVGICISSLTFSDGSKIELGPKDILILTGPNNSGKSSLLREVHITLIGTNPVGPVLKSAEFSKLASDEETLNTILAFAQNTLPVDEDEVIRLPQGGYHLRDIRHFLKSNIRQTPLAPFFLHFLNTEGRLALCNPKPRQNLGVERPNSALSVLEVQSEIEDEISALVKENFGFGLVLNRAGGNHIELRIYTGTQTHTREQYHTKAYSDWMRSLPALAEQGDGVKGFAGLLLALMAQPRSLVLIDEPEAFLHPPQARKIGMQTGRDLSSDAQMIVATHSDDFIRGLLDAGSDRIKVVRIRRKQVADKEVNQVSLLDGDRIKSLWGDAILRTSDLLSGLFHQASIIVEGETDARFLRALLDTLAEAKELKVPDVRFSYGTGFGSIPKICGGLRAVSVPVVIILDPDAIGHREQLGAIVTAAGGDWEKIKPDWQIVVQFLSQSAVSPSVAEVRARLNVAFDALDQAKPFTRGAQAETRKALDVDTPGDLLATKGRNFLVEQLANVAAGKDAPIREALGAFDRLVAGLKEYGILIYPNGVLESLSREDLPKQGWLDRVLQRNLLHDASLGDARQFAHDLVSAVAKAISA